MSTFPGSPRVLKGALVRYSPVADPQIIVFPYNPETLSRTLTPGPPASAENPQPVRPVETIQFTLTVDAADALEASDPQAVANGAFPTLAALELLMYGLTLGTGALTLLVFGPNRILPVRITQLSILERLFDPNLNPIQATVAVTLVVAPPGDQVGHLDSDQFVVQYLSFLEKLAATVYAPTAQATGFTPPAQD